MNESERSRGTDYKSAQAGLDCWYSFTGSFHVTGFLLESTQLSGKNKLSQFGDYSSGTCFDFGVFGFLKSISSNANFKAQPGYNVYGIYLNIPESFGLSRTLTNTKFIIIK